MAPTSNEVRIYEAQAREDARARQEGREPRLITRVEEITDAPALSGVNTSLKNYVPTRQVCKPDLIRIARALGLEASEKETSRVLVERCVYEAERLRRDLELSQRRPKP